jgi:dihydropteroate synthase
MTSAPPETTAPHPELPPVFPRELALPRGGSLPLDGRTRILGILNLTPDSFSDGGLWDRPERAVAQGLELLDEGADLLDLGAESTRPGGGVYGQGADEVPAELEIARLLPVLAELRRRTAAPLSVDTRKGEVAERALAAGADLINDVSGGADPVLLEAVAAAGCPLILMHSRGEIATMQRGIHFDDLLGEVRAELEAMAARAVAAGIARRQLVIDPGLGFGKTWEQNLELLGRLGELAALGLPILVGASRKSFLARALEHGGAAGAGAPPAGRLAGSLAAAAWSLAQGADFLRVHDVAETVRFAAVFRAIGGRSGPAGGEGRWTR